MRSPKVGDIVEINYPRSPAWDGVQFLVREVGSNHINHYKGTVTKTNFTQRSSYPNGSSITWGSFDGVFVFEEDNSRQGMLFKC